MTVCMSLVTLYLYRKMRTEQKSGFDKDGYLPLLTTNNEKIYKVYTFFFVIKVNVKNTFHTSSY